MFSSRTAGASGCPVLSDFVGSTKHTVSLLGVDFPSGICTTQTRCTAFRGIHYSTYSCMNTILARLKGIVVGGECRTPCTGINGTSIRIGPLCCSMARKTPLWGLADMRRRRRRRNLGTRVTRGLHMNHEGISQYTQQLTAGAWHSQPKSRHVYTYSEGLYN